MFWTDYLRDTAHLSTEEHGAYLLLIAHYWNTGKALPADEKYLQKICKISRYKVKKYLPVLGAFFTIEGGKWHHARIERELSGAFDRKDAAIGRGKRAAAVRWADGQSINGAQSKHKPSIPIHIHTMNHDSESENHTGAARDPALNGGSGPRARRAETSKERLARLAMDSRLKLLRKGEA